MALALAPCPSLAENVSDIGELNSAGTAVEEDGADGVRAAVVGSDMSIGDDKSKDAGISKDGTVRKADDTINIADQHVGRQHVA